MNPLAAGNFLSHVLPFLFGGLIVLIFGTLIFKVVKLGGLRGALFGARIVRTVGEVSVVAPRMVKSVVRVHVLGGTDNRDIGLEVVTTSVGSFQMTPVTMSRVDALQLIELLRVATQGR